MARPPVAFGVVVALASGQPLTSFEIALTLMKVIGGGVLCGAIIAAGALLLAGRTDDHLVEITFTTVAAWGSFLLADHFGLSGVLATITAGLLMGNFKLFGSISDRGQEAVQAFWEYAAFVANSLVFLLIGMHEAHRNFVAVWVPAGLAIALVILGRAVADLSVLHSFFANIASRHDETSTYSVLGRLARSIGAGSRPGTSSCNSARNRHNVSGSP